MTVPVNYKCEKAPTLSQATSPQLSLEIVPHGHRDQHHRHEKKAQTHSWITCPSLSSAPMEKKPNLPSPALCSWELRPAVADWIIFIGLSAIIKSLGT